MTTWVAIGAPVLPALAVPAFWPAYLSRPLSADRYTHARPWSGRSGSCCSSRSRCSRVPGASPLIA